MEDEYRVLYCASYGGFGISDEAIKEFNLRSEKKTDEYGLNLNRDNPILLQMFDEMGSKRMSGKYCKLAVASFPIKYKGFLNWDEYDGRESVSIAHDKYLIYKTDDILNDEKLSDTEKVERMKELYKEYFSSITHKQFVNFKDE